MIDWERPDWWDGAKCLGSGPLRYYPEKGDGEDDRSWSEAAKAVCNGEDGNPPCSVRQECLNWALEHKEKLGVWGGRSERERKSIKKLRSGGGSVTRVVKRTTKSSLRQLLDTSKTETRILGGIQRHLMTRPPDDRRQDVIHPSEMAKSDWCPRRTFFRIMGAPALPEESNSFTLENVFAEGHDIHHKWQRWLWEMGLLRGEFLCLSCKNAWAATAPTTCLICAADRTCLQYIEVPLESSEYLIHGHADGDIADDDNVELCPLLEVKSIGTGTLRYEAPALLQKHTHKAKDDDGAEKSLIDYEGLWRDIKRPFPTHLRQVNVYMAISGRRRMVVIYEAKWSQQVKEFRIKFQPEVVADLLDACLDIRYALKTNKPPPRPHWAEIDNTTCGKCVYRESCWDVVVVDAVPENDYAPSTKQSRNGNGRGEHPGEGAAREGRVRLTGASGLRNS